MFLAIAIATKQVDRKHELDKNYIPFQIMRDPIFIIQMFEIQFFIGI